MTLGAKCLALGAHSIIALALFALAPARAHAESGSLIAPSGGEISFENASVATKLDDGSILLVYSNSTEEASFTFPGLTSARILAVGGGGGGGGLWRRAAATSTVGAGAGGGAGGFIEVTNLYGAATYAITVGAGGAAANNGNGDTLAYLATSGTKTVIATNGVTMLTALGGGGGGGQCAGADGASGGGGSKTSGADVSGGKGTIGQGHDGGAGDKALVGAGGGGAGGAGADATDGGAGGVGRVSDITGPSVTYAVGGGGGQIATLTNGATVDTPGSGGGGAGSTKAAKTAVDGNPGIVIVRIDGSMTSGLQKPQDQHVEYDSTNKFYVIEKSPFITIDGNNGPFTDVGVYTAKATPVEGTKWETGSNETVTVSLVITEAGSKSGTLDVTGAPISFFGAATNFWVYNEETKTNDLVLGFARTGSLILPGSSQMRILAVGGGGGGGGLWRRAAATSTVGAGAGGGAGGFIEVTNRYSAATYTINVGAGGAAANNGNSDALAFLGTSGTKTVIATNGVTMLTALGGGGGGGQCAGADGASGGGGSKTSGADVSGGKGTIGQGHDGGAGDKALVGAGGGGAGGAGANATDGGAGGAGRVSDITGPGVEYAVGGGGGQIETLTNGETVDTPGAGGGGAGNTKAAKTAADGKPGIVYIRISSAMEGEFEKPAEEMIVPYDTKEHYSVKNTPFYDIISGVNCGTNVGEYVVTVRLKNGQKWPDETTDDVTVTMKIVPCQVTFSNLSISDWEYRSAPKKPTCVVDPPWVNKVFEYSVQAVGTPLPPGAGEWSETVPTEVGKYLVRVRFVDDGNYVYAVPVEPVPFEITPFTVTIKDLVQKDWMAGTPAEATPPPVCTVIPSDVAVTNEYAVFEDGVEPQDLAADKWSGEVPTAAGEYWIRVSVPDAHNYRGAPAYARFSVVGGLGDRFIDYVEFTVGPYDKTPPLSNFPYRVTLSETDLPGFLYSRAGEDDGKALCFTDASGAVLAYAEGEWDMRGESTVYVKIPEIADAPQTIRLYWLLRSGATVPAHDPDSVFATWDRTAAAKVQAESLEHAFSLVVRNGYRVNYFPTRPKLSKTVWNEGDDPAEVTPPTIFEGRFTTRYLDTLSGTGLTEMPTKPGAYRVSFELIDEKDGKTLVYELPCECHVDFCIMGTKEMGDLSDGSGSATAGGRILLANDDKAPGHEVTGQSYYHTNATEGVYWEHDGKNSVFATLPNLVNYPGVNHRLKFIDASGRTNLLWELKNVLLGNTFRYDALSSEGETKAFLPWSATGLPISGPDGPVGKNTESGWLVMRNIANATIASPCYTNGIGTIYFDAVNTSIGGEIQYLQIVVDVMTNVVDEVTKISYPPTDENIAQHGREAESFWHPVDLHALQHAPGGFTDLGKTTALTLNVTTGKTTDHFYRVYIPLDYRGPARFRIRRPSARSGSSTDDSTYLLALDNILVSFPKSTAALKPYGRMDPTRNGRRTVGQEGAFSVALPSINDNEIYARATNETWISAATNVTAKSLVLLSKMHYRWRYLDQAFDPDPTAADAWKSVDLSPFDDYRASEPLELPRREGDIEFFFELFTSIPYYDYYDYSGSGANLGGFYSEETGTLTNRMSATKDWFFRYRQGRSAWSEISVVMDGAYKANQPMELVGDHLWRGLVSVPTNARGRATFFFDGVDRWETWGTKPVQSKQWFPNADVAKLPSRGDTKAGSAPQGMTLDGASGYYEFQFNDENGVFTVGHAEYQAFNAWHDARRTAGEIFVGNYADTSGVSVAEMVQTNAHMNTWALYRATDPNWNESFDLANYVTPNYPKYTADYISQKMPHSWIGANGVFVDAALTASNLLAKQTLSGIAWQMMGGGKGSVSYTQGDVPSGLDTVSFQARLAQMVSFEEFSPCYSGDTLTMSDYTFVFPALMSAHSGSDYAPNASMSLVGYYFPGIGCYEFRVERRGNDGLQLSIYRWSYVGRTLEGKCIGTQWFTGATMEHGSTKDDVTGSFDPRVPLAWSMFLSLGEENGGTTIIAGLSEDKGDPRGAFSGANYRGLCCVDTSPTRHTFGTFGALPSNCKGEFIAPRHWTKFIPKANVAMADRTPDAGDNTMRVGVFPDVSVKTPDPVKVTFEGSQVDDNELLVSRQWVYPPARTMTSTNRFDNTSWSYGLKAPDDLTQQVGVYLKPASGADSDWALVASNTVSGYAFQSFTATIRTNADCHVRLASGAAPTDVTVWDIKQTAWNGTDIVGIDGLSGDFVFTQAKVDVRDVVGTVTNHCVTLQPARANPAKALSVRSPILKGLGMVGFSYSDVQEGCRVLVQVATNDVRGNLSGTLGYNNSTNAVPLGTPEAIPQWITVQEYGYDDLKGGSEKVCYLGWHTKDDDPLEGVFRIAIAPSVVSAAAGVAKTTPLYGAITITDMYVHDEPAIDMRSWIGFNIRAVGDADDTEKRMILSDASSSTSGDEIGLGLSMALNNSLKQVEGKDPSEYDKVDPCVQSPTFGSVEDPETGFSKQATIGQVRFRARLYETNSAALKPGRISLFGVLDGSTDDWGEALTNFTVSSQVYEQFEYRSPAQESFAAIRLVVDGVIDGATDRQRVLLDEVVVSEKTDSSVGFVYARPFRTGIENDKVIEDILDQSQQPLAGESWGVQTQLKVDQLADDIDVDRGFRVTLRTFTGMRPWGYDRWLRDPGATPEVELVQVGMRTNWVFRSTASDPATIIKPALTGNTIVQYVVTVYYFERGGTTELSATIGASDVEGDGWANPKWYEPVDYNKDVRYSEGHFSPYTILDEVSPGRVWINEVNWNDGELDATENSFIEIAVPWGVDLTDWRLTMTDNELNTVTLAEFGKEVPAVKKSTDGHRSGDYDFVVLVSPKTAKNGNFRNGVTGELVKPDGTWRTSWTSIYTFPEAELMFDSPYSFALYRPSGILEHEIVVGGTNTLWGTIYEEYARDYDGTNLLAVLNEADEAGGLRPKRFFAGNDEAWLPGTAVLSSLNVTTNCHGEAGGWASDMRLTPGSVNERQDELSGWYEKPRGGSIWVYAQVLGEHLSQKIGSDDSRDTFVIVNSGSSTNIEYKADPWYGVGSVTVNGVTNAAAMGKSVYTLSLNNVTETTYVVAREGVSSMLLDAGLDPNDPYAPAIVRWMAARAADGSDWKLYNPEGPIVLGRWKGLQESDPEGDLELRDMYWFDMDPTKPGWWFRGGFADTDKLGVPIRRKRQMNDGWTEHYTNRLVKVKLYLSNDTDKVAYAPYRMQGLNNEQSDVPSTYPNGWVSETFKITAQLDNKLQENFLPLRWFVFDKDSFDENWTSEIEILDPFSLSSPGHSYGWYGWRGTSLFFRWRVDEFKPPVTVEVLDKKSTYDGPPYEPEE